MLQRGKVAGLLRKDFGTKSLTRNPLLMDLVHRAKKVEKAGTGIKRIKDAMRRYGLKVVFDISPYWFTVVFMRKVYGRLNEGIEKDTVKGTVKDTVTLLTTNQKAILEHIKSDPKITAAALSGLLKINVRNTKKNMAELKQKGLLKRIGPDKGGHWEVLD